MYCSTCGSRVPSGRHTCDTCGASLAPRAPLPVMGGGPGGAPVGMNGWRTGPAVGICPRCGYRGEGVSYFSRGTHTAALVGATVLTAGAMGVGGLVYYLVRKDYQVCPRCGRGWGKHGEKALVSVGGAPAPTAPVPPRARDGEPGKRTASVLLFVLAAILMVTGIVSAELAPFVVGLLAAGGGVLFHQAADRSRGARRAALIASHQMPVLKLAAEQGGQLTVTQVAAALGWTLPHAEKVLQSLDDGLRVDSEVTDEGVIVYNFLELRLPPPSSRQLEDPGDR